MILVSFSLEFSVDSQDAKGRTQLMNAAVNGKVQAVKSLMRRGRTKDDGINYNLLYWVVTLKSLL